jgi:hypothetical protein
MVLEVLEEGSVELWEEGRGSVGRREMEVGKEGRLKC